MKMNRIKIKLNTKKILQKLSFKKIQNNFKFENENEKMKIKIKSKIEIGKLPGK